MKNFSDQLVNCNASIREALVKINSISDSSSLALIVTNGDGVVVGSITDGDIRRKLIDNYSLESSVQEVMMQDFKYIFFDHIDVKLIKAYKESGINLLPIVNRAMRLIDIVDFKKNISLLPIDAIIMAGGKGERLRPLTENIPKPLLPINGKPIIDYNVRRLIKFGIKHISVTVNYLKEQIIRHFSNEFAYDVKVSCVSESGFLGTIGSLKLIKSYHNDVVLLMNSDLLTNANYEDFYLHFIEHKADMSVAVVPYSINVPYGIFELDGMNVKDILEKPTYNYFANAGIYLIKKELIDKIPDNSFYNATDLIKLLIGENKTVIRFPLTGYWIDIGNKEEYKKAQELSNYL